MISFSNRNILPEQSLQGRRCALRGALRGALELRFHDFAAELCPRRPGLKQRGCSWVWMATGSLCMGCPGTRVLLQRGACTCNGRASTTSDVTIPTLAGEDSWSPPRFIYLRVLEAAEKLVPFKVITEGGPHMGCWHDLEAFCPSSWLAFLEGR